MLLNALIFFIIGTLFGSLGSVLLVRLSENVTKETMKGILRGRSQCPKCGTTLKARNLIPLISFFRQGGKCEHCKQKISYLYPTLELLSGIVFFLSFLIFSNLGMPVVIFRCIVNRLLLLLIIYDILKYELHVHLRIIFIIVSALPQFLDHQGNYLRALISVAIFTAFFIGIFLLAKGYMRMRYKQSAEGFGEGDVYLGGALGLLVPFIAQYNYLPLNVLTVIDLLLLFIIGSCLVGILFRLLIKAIQHFVPKAFINTVSPLFQNTLDHQKNQGNEVFLDARGIPTTGETKSTNEVEGFQTRLPDGQVSKAVEYKILIPFIPAMIVMFRLLLRKASFFIGLFFPVG